MFKYSIISILFTISIFNGYCQKVNYPENLGNDGLQIIESKSDAITLKFSIEDFQIIESEVEGIIMDKIVWGQAFLPGKEGFPELPSITKNILIPNDAQIEILIHSKSNEILQEILMAPSAKTPGELQSTFAAQRGGQYTENSLYPKSPIQYSITEIRGFKVLRFSIIPFQYNAVSKELVINKNLDIEIKTSSQNHQYGEDKYRSIHWDPILEDIIFNHQDIPTIDYSKREANNNSEGCELLILSPNKPEFLQWADTIRRFRNEQGIHTKIITTEEIGGNQEEIINDFLNEVYQSWNPVPSAILLLGDMKTHNDGIMAKEFFDFPEHSRVIVSDNYYADVSDNELPDFVMGRITAQSQSDLEVIIQKYLEYERHPPVKESFYQQPAMVCGYQVDRWFQMCTESISGYFRNSLGKQPYRIDSLYNYGEHENNPLIDPWSIAPNSEMPISYFGQDGLGYLSPTPNDIGPWGQGSYLDIIDAFNAGSFMIFLRDHGTSKNYWCPNFGVDDLKHLNNIEYPTHLFSMACSNGTFSYGYQSLIEAMHLYENGGIISGTAASDWTYSYYNDCLLWGLTDHIWPGFLPDNGYDQIQYRESRPAFGLAAGKYFMTNSNWIEDSFEKIITNRVWHHFGDPFGMIYTATPINNPVQHEYSITSDVNQLEIESEPYSLIGLSLEGECLISTLSDEDGIAILDFPEQEMGSILKLVVSKQNFFRYEEDIVVIPDEGPFLVFKGHELKNDDNQNGLLDYNEKAFLDIKIRNYGLEDCDNIYLTFKTINDHFEMISDSNILIEEILVNEELVIQNALEISTSLQIPDQYKCQIGYQFENTAALPENQFSIIANAPKIYFHPMLFQEIIGNTNQIPEPGETLDVKVKMTNEGHAAFKESSISISNSNPFISILNPEYQQEEISPSDTISFQYQMEISEEVNDELSYANNYFVEAINSMTIYKEHYFNMGIIIEDFETGNFEKFNWRLEGDQEWEISNDFVHEGSYSASIRELNDLEEAALILDYYLYDANHISFYFQVSSQNNMDQLAFYVDTALMYQWSSLHLFEKSPDFLIPQGLHTLKWVYQKDEETSGGLDKAWIDYIVFPPGTMHTGVELVSQTENNDIRLNPNPSKGEVTINNDTKHSIEHIRVFNIQGLLIHEQRTHISVNDSYPMDLKQMKPGVYLIEYLLSNKSSMNKKFIIY